MLTWMLQMRLSSSETRTTFRSKFSMEEATAARPSWGRKTELAEWLLRPRLPPAPAIKASNWVVGGVWGPPGPHLRFYSPVCQEQEATRRRRRCRRRRCWQISFTATIRRQSLLAVRSESSTLTCFFQDDSTSAPL